MALQGSCVSGALALFLGPRWRAAGILSASGCTRRLELCTANSFVSAQWRGEGRERRGRSSLLISDPGFSQAPSN